MASRKGKIRRKASVYRLNRGLWHFYITAFAALYRDDWRGYFLYMDEARHDSEPANLEDDPLRRIAALERRVAVLTRENERLETFLAILRHKTFGRSS